MKNFSKKTFKLENWYRFKNMLSHFTRTLLWPTTIYANITNSIATRERPARRVQQPGTAARQFDRPSGYTGQAVGQACRILGESLETDQNYLETFAKSDDSLLTHCIYLEGTHLSACGWVRSCKCLKLLKSRRKSYKKELITKTRLNFSSSFEARWMQSSDSVHLQSGWWHADDIHLFAIGMVACVVDLHGDDLWSVFDSAEGCHLEQRSLVGAFESVESVEYQICSRTTEWLSWGITSH